MIRGRRPLTLAGATGGALLLVAAPALAYWTLSGFGEGIASSGSLGKPSGNTSNVTATSMTLNFTPPSGAVGSQTRYTATGTGGKGCSTLIGETSCSVTGLTDGLPYSFTVIATLGAGPNGWSSPASDPFGASTPAVARTFVIDPTTKSATAGTAFAVTLTAKSDGVTDTDYDGVKSIAWSGTYDRTGATLPASATFLDGVATFNVTLTATGSGTLIATEGSRTATMNVTVGAATPSDTTKPTTQITVPAADTAGGVVARTITATGTDEASGVSVQLQVNDGSGWTNLGTAATATTTNTATASASWTPPQPGAYQFQSIATDGAGNSQTSAPRKIDVYDVQANVGNSQMAKNDTITFRFPTTMSTTSLKSGWTDGATATQVFVRITNGVSGGNDVLRIYSNVGLTTLVPLGSVDLGRTDYVSSDVTFGDNGSGPGNHSTMIQSGGDIIVTLGQVQPGGTVTTSNTGTMVWTPSADAKTTGGASATTTPITESGAIDRDF